MRNIPSPLLLRIKSFNENISRIFKIDINYLMRGGTLLSLTQLTSAFFGLLMTYAFAKYLPAEIFGTYKYVLATYTMLVIASLPGLDTAIIETISKGNHRAFYHAIKTKFKYGFIGSILSFSVGLYYWSTGNIELLGVFCLVGLFLPFMEAMSLYNSFLNAEKKFATYAFFEITNQLASTVSLFVTIFFTTNIYVLMAAYFLPYILIKSIATFYTLKKLVRNDLYDSSYLSYGKTMSWFQIISRGMTSIDQMVLFHFMGPVQVAIFSIAIAIPQRFQSVLKITGSLAFPKYANISEKTLADTLPRKMFYFGLAIILACLFYILVAPYFFQYFFPKYLESVKYSQLIILFTISGITYPFASFLSAQRKVKESYIYAISSFTIKFACLMILVPIYGIWGAAWGVVLSSTTHIILTYYYISVYKNKTQS